MKAALLVLVGLSLALAGAASAVTLSHVATPPPNNPPQIRTDEYQLDDGIGDNSIGLTAGGTLVWLNRFNVLAGFETLTAISVAFGQVNGVQTGVVEVFNDPNNDNQAQDITSANLLASAPCTSNTSNSDNYVSFSIPATNLGAVGNTFYIGVCLAGPAGDYPARIDQTASQYRSWVGGDGSLTWGGCANPNSGGLGTLNIIDNYGLPGNWMVRGTAGETPVYTTSWSKIKSLYN